MDLSTLLKKLVEKKNLDNSEAEMIMRKIMEGTIEAAQAGAFLMGLKMKGESFSEIASFAKIMREKSQNMDGGGLPLIDTCGTGGDGLNTINISTASAIVAASAGCNVAKHGNRSISSKCGSADVLDFLGVPFCSTSEEFLNQIKLVNIAFLFAPKMHQAMKNVMPIRKSLGIPTVFNLLGPLASPAKVKKQVIGVSKRKQVEIYIQVLKLLGHDSAYVVNGDNGMDEVSISGSTHIASLKNNQISYFEINPKEFNIDIAPIESILGGSAEENANILLDVFKGKKGPHRDVVCLNAALAIDLFYDMNNLQEAYKRACFSIDEGKTIDLINRWKNLA